MCVDLGYNLEVLVAVLCSYYKWLLAYIIVVQYISNLTFFYILIAGSHAIADGGQVVSVSVLKTIMQTLIEPFLVWRSYQLFMNFWKSWIAKKQLFLRFSFWKIDKKRCHFKINKYFSKNLNPAFLNFVFVILSLISTESDNV